MTQELARSLDEELAALTPPSAITSATILHKGHKAVFRRRSAVGGAIASGIAAVVAVAVLVAPGAPPDDRGTFGEAAAPQPAFPLPALDPGTDYVWHDPYGDPQITDATEETTKAWHAAVAEIEGATLYAHADNGDWVPLTETNRNPITRDERDMYRIVGDQKTDPDTEPVGYAAPYFNGGDVALAFGGSVLADSLWVSVHANGSFLPGAGQPYGNSTDEAAPYLAAGCEDYGYQGHDEVVATVDYTCAESTGPGDERVLTVRTLMARDGLVFHRELTVVLYRLDGTAVVVTDQLTDISKTRTSMAEADLGLTPENLLGLALALPSVTVD